MFLSLVCNLVRIVTTSISFCYKTSRFRDKRDVSITCLKNFTLFWLESTSAVSIKIACLLQIHCSHLANRDWPYEKYRLFARALVAGERVFTSGNWYENKEELTVGQVTEIDAFKCSSLQMVGAPGIYINNLCAFSFCKCVIGSKHVFYLRRIALCECLWNSNFGSFSKYSKNSLNLILVGPFF